MGVQLCPGRHSRRDTTAATIARQVSGSELRSPRSASTSVAAGTTRSVRPRCSSSNNISNGQRGRGGQRAREHVQAASGGSDAAVATLPL
jgi:hypothetical protein